MRSSQTTVNALLSSSKSYLADVMWNQVPDVPSAPEDQCPLLDEGALLHRISWPRGETYDVICSRYTTFNIGCYKIRVLPLVSGIA